MMVRGLLLLLAGLSAVGCAFTIPVNLKSDPSWQETTPAGRLAPGPSLSDPPPAPAVSPRTSGGEPLVVAVMELQDASGSLSEAERANATEMLRGLVAATGAFVVIDKGRQEQKLRALVKSAREESYAACVDRSCQIPLGQSLAADTILRTSLSCLGTACLVAAELVDLEKEATIAGGTADFEGGVSGLPAALRTMVQQLAHATSP